MKYCSINEMDTFNYHDVYIENAMMIGDDMIWSVSNINVTTKNSQNPYDCDMCVNKLRIIFKHYKVMEVCFLEKEVWDSQGNVIRKTEAKIANIKEIESILSKMREGGACLYFGGVPVPYRKNEICFDIGFTDNTIDLFNLKLEFTEFLAEWDQYDGKAWYVNEEVLPTKVTNDVAL